MHLQLSANSKIMHLFIVDEGNRVLISNSLTLVRRFADQRLFYVIRAQVPLSLCFVVVVLTLMAR